MFVHHNRFGAIMRWVGISVSIGICVWLGVLWFQSAQLRAAQSGSRDIRIAGVALMRIEKSQAAQGTKAFFTFAPSFALYWVAWIVIGMLIGAVRPQHDRDGPPVPQD